MLRLLLFCLILTEIFFRLVAGHWLPERTGREGNGLNPKAALSWTHGMADGFQGVR